MLIFIAIAATHTLQAVLTGSDSINIKAAIGVQIPDPVPIRFASDFFNLPPLLIVVPATPARTLPHVHLVFLIVRKAVHEAVGVFRGSHDPVVSLVDYPVRHLTRAAREDDGVAVFRVQVPISLAVYEANVNAVHHVISGSCATAVTSITVGSAPHIRTRAEDVVPVVDHMGEGVAIRQTERFLSLVTGVMANGDVALAWTTAEFVTVRAVLLEIPTLHPLRLAIVTNLNSVGSN